MNSKIFFFGDSFTFGHGVSPSETWAYHIFKYFNASKYFNFAKNGFSNESIFDSIMDNFNLIHEKDIVFVLLGKSDRFNYIKDKKFLDFRVRDTNDDILDKYWYNFIYPYRETLLREKDNKKGKFFESIFPCRSFVLNRTDYRGQFETIKQASLKKIRDNHWSKKGHRDFADYIIKELLD